MFTRPLVYIALSLLLISVVYNLTQYFKTAHYEMALTKCDSSLSLQSQAINNLHALQLQTQQDQKTIAVLAAEKLQIQTQQYSGLKSPDECLASIKWGINQAELFKK